MSSQKIKVLYIAGWGRSGSTIIDNILGQLDGFCSVGELRYIWDRGLQDNKLCGCGKLFNDCEIWNEIFRKAFGEKRNINSQRLLALRESLCRTRHIPSMLMGNKYMLNAGGQLKEFIDVLTSLYSAIGHVRRSNIIIDSSKWPSYGYILSMIPNIALYVLHLVRDPRAVAFSWMRTKELERSKSGAVEMPRINPITSTSFWLTWNFATEQFFRKKSSRYLFVRYEDFVKTPKSTVDTIVDFLGEKRNRLPFINESKVVLRQNHTVSGNPSRFNIGEIALKEDNEWLTKMNPLQKTVITILAFPLLKKYNYI